MTKDVISTPPVVVKLNVVPSNKSLLKGILIAPIKIPAKAPKLKTQRPFLSKVNKSLSSLSFIFSESFSCSFSLLCSCSLSSSCSCSCSCVHSRAHFHDDLNLFHFLMKLLIFFFLRLILFFP